MRCFCHLPDRRGRAGRRHRGARTKVRRTRGRARARGRYGSRRRRRAPARAGRVGSACRAGFALHSSDATSPPMAAPNPQTSFAVTRLRRAQWFSGYARPRAARDPRRGPWPFFVHEDLCVLCHLQQRWTKLVDDGPDAPRRSQVGAAQGGAPPGARSGRGRTSHAQDAGWRRRAVLSIHRHRAPRAGERRGALTAGSRNAYLNRAAVALRSAALPPRASEYSSTRGRWRTVF